MRILIFNQRDTKHPEAGGAELNIDEQAKLWISWGHQVTMFTSRPRGLPRRDCINGVQVFRAGGRFGVYFSALLAYLAFLRRKADVIVDVTHGLPFFTPIFSRKPRICQMLHVHREQFTVELGPALGLVGRFIERYLIPLAYRNTAIIAISQSTADRLREVCLGGGRLDVRVIYCGLDHSRFSPGNGNSTRPTVLYLGRIKKYKRLDRLIAMMSAVRREIPSAELLIAGSGDAVEEVEELVERLEVGDFVHFLGYVPEEEKVDLYRRSWVLATPSMNEGWGITIIEANACGTPAVAFRVPGLDESIAHGESGLLAEDEDEFTGHLVKVLGDGSLRDKLSRGAVERSREFTWDETARRTLQVLEEVAGDNR